MITHRATNDISIRAVAIIVVTKISIQKIMVMARNVITIMVVIKGPTNPTCVALPESERCTAREKKKGVKNTKEEKTAVDD